MRSDKRTTKAIDKFLRGLSMFGQNIDILEVNLSEDERKPFMDALSEFEEARDLLSHDTGS
ncbi:MAG: hypothetical protein AAF098_13465 [Pseudomonadota bacterium]